MEEFKREEQSQMLTEEPEKERGAESAYPTAKKVTLYKTRRWQGVRGSTCFLLCLACFMLGIVFTMLYYGSRYEDLIDIADAIERVEEEYYFYDENTKEEIITGALKGIASYLEDRYATYYTEEEYAELMQTDSGNYVGMGVQVTQEESGDFVLSAVFPNTPAQEAGLLVGDRLISANGQSAEGLDLDTFLANLGHEEGDVNTVVVERKGEQLSFTVTMRQVYQPFVEYKMLSGNIGYICIMEFHGDADEEVEKALAELKEQGMEKLVLDLRDNPGGSLSTVCSMAELFLPEDSLITTIRSRKGGEETYYTHDSGTDIPMAVLINGSSASASELLSGALKDHGRAKLFGTTTFGKGIVQTLFGVRGYYKGVIKFTTDAYYTPNDVCIHGEGVTPDVEVELGEDVVYYAVYDIPYEQDTQLQAAVEYLGGL